MYSNVDYFSVAPWQETMLSCFSVNFMTICERSKKAGKSKLSRGHSFLFSGSKMTQVVTGKQNGGPPISWSKLQSQQIIQFALFTMGHLSVHQTIEAD